MSPWQPGPRPDWVRMLNGLGDAEWIPLHPEALLEAQGAYLGDWGLGFRLSGRRT